MWWVCLRWQRAILHPAAMTHCITQEKLTCLLVTQAVAVWWCKSWQVFIYHCCHTGLARCCWPHARIHQRCTEWAWAWTQFAIWLRWLALQGSFPWLEVTLKWRGLADSAVQVNCFFTCSAHALCKTLAKPYCVSSAVVCINGHLACICVINVLHMCNYSGQPCRCATAS